MPLSAVIEISMLASLLCLTTPCTADPTADALLRQIDIRGAKRVLGHLTSDWDRFEGACDLIETGDAGWLEVARRLKPASDAASSLSLNFSVARALPRVPDRVLKLIGRGFSVHDVCTSPFIEPEPGIAEAYEKAAAAALRRLRVPELQTLKEQCLAAIALSP